MKAKHSHPQSVIAIAIKQLGTMQAVADALQIDRTTVSRWYSGDAGLRGTGLVALMALIRHPEDFQRYKVE